MTTKPTIPSLRYWLYNNAIRRSFNRWKKDRQSSDWLIETSSPCSLGPQGKVGRYWAVSYRAIGGGGGRWRGCYRCKSERETMEEVCSEAKKNNARVWKEVKE